MWSERRFLGAGIVVILDLVPPSGVLTLAASGLIGIGVGSSVAPALFIAGWSLASKQVQRVFALVELAARAGGVHDRADPAALRPDRGDEP